MRRAVGGRALAPATWQLWNSIVVHVDRRLYALVEVDAEYPGDLQAPGNHYFSFAARGVAEDTLVPRNP